MSFSFCYNDFILCYYANFTKDIDRDSPLRREVRGHSEKIIRRRCGTAPP